jgi:hypothetical protein
MLVETVSTDVRSCGIIVTDLSQPDAFKFAHKYFFELLIAQNVIYTHIRQQLTKDTILHHGAKSSAGVEASAGLNREMIQFAAETLYRLAGGQEKDSYDLERALVKLGIPVRNLKIVARYINTFFMAPAGAYMLIFLGRSRTFLPILAHLFKIHGTGGDDFVSYGKSAERFLQALRRLGLG